MYNSKAHTYFSDTERKRIETATSEAESKSIGEIAVMVVDESSHYREGAVIGGIVLANFVAFILAVFCFHESIWWYVPTVFVLFFPSMFLFWKVPALKAWCVGDKRKDRAVKDRAVRAFYEKGLYRTKNNTGVLFFISLLEHKVWVIADKGIHEKITQSVLDNKAHRLAQGIREGRATDSMAEIIGEVGDLLAQYFPYESSDTNELSDMIIYEH